MHFHKRVTRSGNFKGAVKKTHFVGVLCFLFKSNFVPFYLLKLNDRT